MPNRLQIHRIKLAVFFLMTGLLVMILHPVTHVFDLHSSEHNHEQSDLPLPEQDSDDCIECILTANSAFEGPLSKSCYSLTGFSNLYSSESNSENHRIIIGFSLRGPPSSLYMS